MAKVGGLVGELRTQVKALEDDLKARVDGPDVHTRQDGVYERWHAEWEHALKAQRTAASWVAWRDERVTQAAVAWVLVTVFARFCEDNELVRPLWIAGHTKERRQEAQDARRVYFQRYPEHNDRHWLTQIVEHFASVGATAGLVDEYSPLHQVSPSGDAARALLEFWWETDAEGELLRTFRSDDLDTRFLGDLYQDLSESARKTYALLQTPEFVEEFILDQTFEPALAERPLEGFTVIDPTCGSGHFLLGAFARLRDAWARKAPGLEDRVWVQRALDGVYGVDINPFAVAIARFRLVVAALAATGERSLDNAPAYQLNLAAGDSLLFGASQQALSDDLFSLDEAVFAYSIEDRQELERILHARYDVVVGNPPYITPKDKALNAAYRELYSTCHMKYALSVPFMELFFGLGKTGERPGWIGQITSNSFMKREFGAPLIEKFLARKDLRAVIDTSGAYIPGHGTPTVIITARNQSKVDDMVRTVLGVRGEPGRPDKAAKGLVWSSIVDHIDDARYDDDWVSVADLDRVLLDEHPWSLSGGGAAELVGALDDQAAEPLSQKADSIGLEIITKEDSAYFIGRTAITHARISKELIRPIVLGENLRDWSVSDPMDAIFPYDGMKLTPRASSAVLRLLWPVRRILEARITFGKSHLERGFEWYEFSMFTKKYHRPSLKIASPLVATHPSFVLNREDRIFQHGAPVIKLPEGASEDDHLELLGVLNSSVACFWLKQNSHNKGSTVDNAGARTTLVPWENFYEFTGTTLKDFPLPKALPLERARALDRLARELAEQSPRAVAERGVPSREALDQAHAEHERIRAELVALQEELDWECYRLYGLIDEDLTYGGAPPGLQLGERAFEIVLARKMADGEDTAWFERHRSMPITGIPAQWPADYRDLVQRRLDVIAENKNIRLLEKPEYKRRWAIEPWDKRVKAALQEWLLDRLEARELWFDRQGRPQPRSVAQLADQLGRDADVRSVLELWADQPDVPMTKALQELLKDQPVPYLAAYRYKPSGMDKRAAWEHTWELQRKEDAGGLPLNPTTKLPDPPIPVPPKYQQADFVKGSYWKHRGKLDVPKERFIGYPDAGRETDPTPLLGWAGWDHAQQALALASIMNQRAEDGWDDERMVPLIAGLAELQPWLDQWHADVDPTYGVSLAAYLKQELDDRAQRAGKTLDDLKAWRPPKPTRGRRTRRS